MTDTDTAAYLANVAYKAPQERQAALQSKYGNRYQVDNQRNFQHYGVVRDTQTNRIYHLHRGTVNGNDVMTDAHLAVGNLRGTDRYKYTDLSVRDTNNHYYGQEQVHIGHSLGGTLADTYARQYGHQSIAFNMGSSPFANQGSFNDQHQHIRTNTDFVSSFAPKEGAQTIEKSNRLDSLFKSISTPVWGASLHWSVPAAVTTANAYFGHKLGNFF